jgi:endonuclease/exonuclease/phosphatase (EEP) superfamily protein YafD
MTTPPVAKMRRMRTARIAPWCLATLALVHPLAILCARLNWRIDLFTHFQEPALALTLLAALTALRERRKLAACLALLAVTQVAPLVRYSGRNPVPPDADSQERLRIVAANVLEPNQEYGRVDELIREEQPDVVGLIEVTPGLLKALEPLRREFPYRTELPTGGRGFALWFRLPPRSMDAPEVLVDGGNAVVHATVTLGGVVRHLWLVHIPNPIGRRRGSSNPDLSAIAERIRHTPGSHVVFGDFNRTDGSPFLRDFLRATRLRDSRLGFGRQPSWPVWSWYRIAIDHAFLSQDLAVAERRLGPPIGSDHLPLVLEVAPVSGASAATIDADRVAHASSP